MLGAADPAVHSSELGEQPIIGTDTRKSTDHPITPSPTSAVTAAASACLPDFPSLAIPSKASNIPTVTSDPTTQQKKADITSINKDGPTLCWKPRPKRGSNAAPAGGVRGKGNNGWGNLPPQILRIVIGHALELTRLEQPYRSRWQYDRQALAVIIGLQRKEWMFGLRNISPGWRSAVDNHPFWTQLIYRLDPHFNPSTLNPTAPLASSRSNTKQPTPFQLARRVCSQVCIPCRLFQPPLARPLPAEPEYANRLNHLGDVGTCEWHNEKYCYGCLVSEYPADSVNPHGDIMLNMIVDNDVDDSGEYLPLYVQLCKVCRKAGIDAAILRQLKDCARGGPIRGLSVKWHTMDEYDEYVHYSADTAENAAYALIIKWALTSLAEDKYIALEDIARELQTMEYRSKVNLFSRKLAESVTERQERWELMTRLEPHKQIDPEEDRIDRGKMLSRWMMEYNNKGPRWLAALDEKEEAEGLNRRFAIKHRNAFLDHFILERVRNGIWVLPSLEIALSSTLIRAPFFKDIDPTRPFSHPYYPLPSLRPIISSIAHPFPLNPYILQKPTIDASTFLCSPDRSTGLFCIVPGVQCSAEPVLPPQQLEEELDERFKGILRGTLVQPLRRMMAEILGAVGDEQAAEKICSKMGLKQVLEGLRTESVWFKQETVDSRRSGTEGRGKVGCDDERVIPVVRKQPSGDPRSPIVELVQSDPAHAEGDELMQPDFGIKVDEEWTEDVPGDTIQEVEKGTHDLPVRHDPDRVSLGKRKSPPTDVHTGSDRQIRVKADGPGSRETSLATSASTTPTDEVIMPITPEDIVVETLQKAAVKGQTTEKRLATNDNASNEGAGGRQPLGETADEEHDDEEDSSVTIDSGDDTGRDEHGHYDNTSEYQSEEYDDHSAKEEEEELTPPPPGLTPPPPGLTPPPPGLTPPPPGLTPPPPGLTPPSPHFDHSLPHPHPSDLHTRLTAIPHIPLPPTDDPSDPVTEMLAGEVIIQLWWDVRRPLRVCRCGICERARERERRERENAWMGLNLMDMLNGRA